MEKLVDAFISHLKSALDIADEFKVEVKGTIDNAVVLGMGGSGIGGSIAAQVLSQELTIPVESCKDYVTPSYISENTLIIASSYSGNTEETLAALDEASKKTNHIVCITSGGRIKEIAESTNYGLIVIPGGMPPRAALGLSLPQLFKVFASYGLIDFDVRQNFESSIELLSAHSETIKSKARDVAEILKDKLPIIYSQTDYEGVGIRFRQQINENSKKLCWHHVVPEMNHNELVGWRIDASKMAVVMLRNNDDLSRNQKRMELSKGVFTKHNAEIIELFSKGKNKLERSLYLVHLCDWISVYIAEMNGTDPVEIEVINFLKGELAKV